MKLVPVKSVKLDFLQVYNEAVANTLTSSKQDPKRLYNLRCSQLPYCSASVLVNYAQRGKYQAMDLMMAYYVGVGHAVHHVMQTYLSQSGRFLADYTCKECDKVHKLSHQSECCGFPTVYDEIDLDYNGVQGHIDAVFKDRQGQYWILDFKTTSLSNAQEKAKRPPENYKRQVRAYAYLLWKQHKIKVVGLMLVFIPRDNPKEPTVWEHRIKETDFDNFRSELLVDLRTHRKTMMAKTIEDMKPLLVSCGGQYCRVCAHTRSRNLGLLTKHLNKFPIKADSK
jgi:hypothetical protein